MISCHASKRRFCHFFILVILYILKVSCSFPLYMVLFSYRRSSKKDTFSSLIREVTLKFIDLHFSRKMFLSPSFRLAVDTKIEMADLKHVMPWESSRNTHLIFELNSRVTRNSKSKWFFPVNHYLILQAWVMQWHFRLALFLNTMK